MAYVKTDSQHYTDIADAIRYKIGVATRYLPSEMAAAIRAISGGVEPVEKTWNIVPSHVQAFLNWAADHPYDPSDYSNSYFDDHEAVHDDDPVGVVLSLPSGTLNVTDGYNEHSYSVAVQSGNKTVYNLIPGSATYSVESTNGIKAVGSLFPTGARRFICGGGTYDQNMRDLGGIPCNGGSIKFGKIIRGGAVYPGDTETVRILHDEVGIRAELDLLNGHLGYTSSPIGDDVDFCCPIADNWDWAYYYLTYTDQMREAFRFIFDSVARGRMLYMHCQQGADRTGTLAVLVEGLLGVSQPNIDVDYELTSFSADTTSVRKRSNTAYQALITRINAMSGNTFQMKVVNYVASLGFTAAEINDFITAMVDGTPAAITPSISTYSVTNTLSHATNDNTAQNATQYQPYEANIKAADGYVIDSVTVTMGGVDVTGQMFSGAQTVLRREVTNTLTHCATNNTKISVIQGEGYGATITPDNGYTLDGATVQITMGGIDVSNYYSGGNISIPSVTGDLVIAVTAVESAPAYHNLADPTSAEWKDGYRITSSGISAQSGKTVCNPISVAIGDVVRVKGVSFVTGADRYQITGKNGSGTAVSGRDYISNLPNTALGYSLIGDVHTFTVTDQNIVTDGQLCFAFDTPSDPSVVIITKNEEIV